jgi:hypothetical protein
MSNQYTIIPSVQQYESAPADDQQVPIVLEEQSQNLVEYDRTTNVSLAQVFDDERQESTIFRPTFKVSYLYSNVFTGTTNYLPFQYNLFYVDPEGSLFNNVWKGYPQYYEFDFFRNDIADNHIDYYAKSAYTYNWTYNITYAYDNDYKKQMSAVLNNNSFNWIADEGIPFVIKRSTENGNGIISFECICVHGLTVGESVELIINGVVYNYRQQSLFEVYSLGNGLFDSDLYIFNVYDIGFTGTTLNNNVKGTFKRVTNSDNPLETKSKYYVRRHKVLQDVNNIIVTKAGFEKLPFGEERKLELSSITPNQVTRISQKTSSNVYTFTPKRDIDLGKLIDNQKRPLTELFLTIINRGYSGYFNKPTNGVGLKQGWLFNITKFNNSWWSDNNTVSNSNIGVSSYTQTNGATKTFYYNQSLKIGDIIDGDFCEWNDYEQVERVVSPYYHKIRFNQDVFQTVSSPSPNTAGYYYNPHTSITIQVFSDYIETGDVDQVQNVPTYAFYSNTDQQFRWRDLYTYGFFDQLGRGVDYPFFNKSHYPYKNTIVRLTPDDKGFNINDTIQGIGVPVKPLIDGCE